VDFRIIILGGETVCCTPPPPKAGEPPEPPAPTSTPLENIRGIGPSKARKLRAAGIKDIETLLKTDTAKLVEIAGFDANIKRDATAALKKAKEK
jgi:predicted flap endonuclease-1-like 5' DNA nuclease